MKRYTVFFCFFLLTETTFSNDLSDINYFPLALGNIWNYQYWDIVEKGITTSRLVSDSIWIGDKFYYQLTYQGEYTGEYCELIRYDFDGRVWLRTGEIDQLWFDFSLSDSSLYKFVRNDFGDTVDVLVRENQIVKTRIGEFQNCKVFYFDNTKIYDDDFAYYFAPSVGPVKIRYSHWAEELLAGYYFPDDSIKVAVGKKLEQRFGVNSCILFYNYPNPFNSSTIIHYKLYSPCRIRLEIYNIYGQIVDILVNEDKSQGDHYITYYAKNISTGIYFARIMIPDQIKVIQMLYLR